MKRSKAERFLEELTDIDDRFIEEAMNYTMKKRFNFKPIIAVAACAVFALAAIPVANHFANTPTVQGTQSEKLGASGEFAVYESDIHDATEIGNHNIDIKLNSVKNIYFDEAKKGTKTTITLNGLEWTALYESSLTETDYNIAVNRYEGNCNGKKVSFVVNPDTGKCEFFMVHNEGEMDTTGNLTRDELYEIAYNIFRYGGYTDDPENYTLSYEDNQGAGGYCFRFCRFVNGIQTCEYVTIGLKNNGEFFWYMGNRIGEMKDVDVSRIDMEKFYNAVEVKLKKIYGDAYVDFDRNGAVLTKMADGSYIFDYKLNVDVTDNKTGDAVQDTCYLAITID